MDSVPVVCSTSLFNQRCLLEPLLPPFLLGVRAKSNQSSVHSRPQSFTLTALLLVLLVPSASWWSYSAILMFTEGANSSFCLPPSLPPSDCLLALALPVQRTWGLPQGVEFASHHTAPLSFFLLLCFTPFGFVFRLRKKDLTFFMVVLYCNVQCIGGKNKMIYKAHFYKNNTFSTLAMKSKICNLVMHFNLSSWGRWQRNVFILNPLNIHLLNH